MTAIPIDTARMPGASFAFRPVEENLAQVEPVIVPSQPSEGGEVGLAHQGRGSVADVAGASVHVRVHGR